MSPPSFGHKGCEESGWKVRAGGRSLGQLWQEWKSAARCLEGWRPPTWTLPLERRSHPHCWGVVRTRPPNGDKLVGSTEKVEAQVGTWLRRRLSLKGRADACAVYVFSVSLYRLSVLLLPKGSRVALKQSLSKLLWGGRSPMVRIQVSHQRLCNGGLGMPDLESYWLAERLAFLGRSLTRDTVLADGWIPFFAECRKALRNLSGSSDLSRSRKELYREFVVGTDSDQLEERLVWSRDEIRSQWSWAPGSGLLNNSEFSLTWQLARNALLLAGRTFKVGLADMPDCTCCSSGLEETTLPAFYYCERVRFGDTSESGRPALIPNR